MMRGIDTRIVLVAVLLAAASASAMAQSDVPRSPAEGGPRIFEVTARLLNLRERQSSAAPVTATVKRGTILSNLGCSRAGGHVWCDVQPLTGGARGYVAARYVRPAVSPHGAVATGPDNSALRAGQGDFDATGPVPCTKQPAGPMGQCQMGVARAGGGFATVVVTHPDGTKRALYFSNGVAIGADTSEADYSGPFAATRGKASFVIKVGKERYEIIDAIIFGG